VLVYWDSIYSAFMFAFASGTPSASGAINDASGKPVAGTQVALTSGGKTFTTYTDASGSYRFYDVPQGQATVSAGGQKTTATVGSGTKLATLKLAT
jgi:hypothetical protein